MHLNCEVKYNSVPVLHLLLHIALIIIPGASWKLLGKNTVSGLPNYGMKAQLRELELCKKMFSTSNHKDLLAPIFIFPFIICTSSLFSSQQSVHP